MSSGFEFFSNHNEYSASSRLGDAEMSARRKLTGMPRNSESDDVAKFFNALLCERSSQSLNGRLHKILDERKHQLRASQIDSRSTTCKRDEARPRWIRHVLCGLHVDDVLGALSALSPCILCRSHRLAWLLTVVAPRAAKAG